MFITRKLENTMKRLDWKKTYKSHWITSSICFGKHVKIANPCAKSAQLDNLHTCKADVRTRIVQFLRVCPSLPARNQTRNRRRTAEFSGVRAIQKQLFPVIQHSARPQRGYCQGAAISGWTVSSLPALRSRAWAQRTDRPARACCTPGRSSALDLEKHGERVNDAK